MTKRIAILQSNYIPWKGYFDLIAAVDEFILYDDMQYTRRDWRNRNQIKTPQGPLWLSIPVRVKGRFHQTIRETELESPDWGLKHWKTISSNYRQAPYYSEISSWLEPIYTSGRHTHLSPLNRDLIEAICGYLGITTRITNSWDYVLSTGKTERLADLCVQAGATEYVSGPAARTYIEESCFTDRHIKLSWFEYSNYSVYPQLHGSFTHFVSIIDLLLNCGPNAFRFKKHVHS